MASLGRNDPIIVAILAIVILLLFFIFIFGLSPKEDAQVLGYRCHERMPLGTTVPARAVPIFA